MLIVPYGEELNALAFYRARIDFQTGFSLPLFKANSISEGFTSDYEASRTLAIVVEYVLDIHVWTWGPRDLGA